MIRSERRITLALLTMAISTLFQDAAGHRVELASALSLHRPILFRPVQTVRTPARSAPRKKGLALPSRRITFVRRRR